MFAGDLVAVFIPSTPNPTTGFLLYLDPHEVLVVDLEVEEAVKLIVSAGMVVPPITKTTPQTLAEEMGLPPREKPAAPRDIQHDAMLT